MKNLKKYESGKLINVGTICFEGKINALMTKMNQDNKKDALIAAIDACLRMSDEQIKELIPITTTIPEQGVTITDTPRPVAE